MTRILFWNVNNVGTQSLFPAPNKRARRGNEGAWVPGGQAQAVQDGVDRLEVLTNVINAVEPQIVSIAEVRVGGGAPAEGTVVNDNAMLRLCRTLHNETGGAWRVVPPVVVGTGGRREGVAVFYRAEGLRFLGPWGWSGALAEPIANIEAEGWELATYGPPWSGGGWAALPGTAIGAGWPTVNRPQNRLAAQWQYNDAEGNRIHFPGEGNRGPVLTWFGEPGFPGGRRVIKLLSYHAPPEQHEFGEEVAPSAAGTAALAQITEMNAAEIAAREVRCIVGDFNVSAWVDAVDEASYAPLRANGYIQHPNPRGRVTEGVEPPAELEYGWPAAGYYATHGRPVNPHEEELGANPWMSYFEGVEAEPVFQGYPGFGWASRPGERGRYDAIDGIFTRHGAEAGAAAAFTIANPITGSPYTAEAEQEVPEGIAVGTRVVASQMAAAPGVFGLPAGVPQLPLAPGLAARETFIGWENYGQIRSLSDHLPVVIDV